MVIDNNNATDGTVPFRHHLTQLVPGVSVREAKVRDIHQTEYISPI